MGEKKDMAVVLAMGDIAERSILQREAFVNGVGFQALTDLRGSSVSLALVSAVLDVPAQAFREPMSTSQIHAMVNDFVQWHREDQREAGMPAFVKPAGRVDLEALKEKWLEQEGGEGGTH